MKRTQRTFGTLIAYTTIIMRTLNLILLLLVLVSGASFGQVSEVGPEKSDVSKAIIIYPNPATDFVNVKLTTLNARQAKLTMYNILGNEIQTEVEVVDDHEVRFRVKELSAGYYLIAVRDEQTQFKGTYKFLKR
jgi:hypothetical protein